MSKDPYVTAQDAATELGVSLPTLYAYVSRGLLRSESTDSSRRTRRYYQEDVQHLKDRKELRRNPTKAVAKALHWGAPVLESAITLFDNGRLYYRGHDVLTLATSRTVEEVAALIWLGDLEMNTAALFDSHDKKLPARCLALRRRLSDVLSDLAPLELFQVMLPLAATEDVAAYDLHPLAVAQTGARILRLLALTAVSRARSEGDIPHILQEGWGSNDPAAASLLRTALILCADHELNVSAFTARCTASANSPPYAVVMAGLAALQGAKHGGYTDQVEAFLREVGVPDHAPAVITHRLKRGERLPGFGHQLYPEGDPRGKALLELTMKAYPNATAIMLSKAITTQVRRTINQHPTIDFALAILASALRLPSGAALALFAMGRTIGWIGHAIEQYQLDQLIRPRAQYVGPAPLPQEQARR